MYSSQKLHKLIPHPTIENLSCFAIQGGWLQATLVLFSHVAPPSNANFFVNRGKIFFTHLHFEQRSSPKIFSSLRIAYVLPSLKSEDDRINVKLPVAVVDGGAPPLY